MRGGTMQNLSDWPANRSTCRRLFLNVRQGNLSVLRVEVWKKRLGSPAMNSCRGEETGETGRGKRGRGKRGQVQFRDPYETEPVFTAVASIGNLQSSIGNSQSASMGAAADQRRKRQSYPLRLTHESSFNGAAADQRRKLDRARLDLTLRGGGNGDRRGKRGRGQGKRGQGVPG